ncbi:MAG: D-glycero-beta-D-manno-heptose-1,7-bisphosphate 7-phosphatase [Desulfuromonas sp.]|nr:MAG: D-glycero-beta-D-manno-heptose-1,7-bisphosphate 7-phosphatase [Desulfuromonas sp.]
MNSPHCRPLRPAVFLDRDGTINVEKHYLYKIEDFEFIAGAPESIRRLKDAGFLVIVITNQSGIGRGYYSLEAVTRLHQHIQKELAAIGTAIDAFYVCPHHPTEGKGQYRIDCACRKPAPGMITQAADELGVDLKCSYLVGDKMADIDAARASGCTPMLVRTGYGSEQLLDLADEDLLTFDTLIDATENILDNTLQS